MEYLELIRLWPLLAALVATAVAWGHSQQRIKIMEQRLDMNLSALGALRADTRESLKDIEKDLGEDMDIIRAQLLTNGSQANQAVERLAAVEAKLDIILTYISRPDTKLVL